MATSFEPAFAEAESTALPGWIETIRATQSGFSAGLPFGASTAADKPLAEGSQDALTIARAEGEAAGYEAAKAEFEAELAQIETSVLQIEQAFAEQLAALLNETVVALCKKALSPLALDEENLAMRCELAAKALKDELANAILSLNPDDLALIEPKLGDTLTLEPDPQLPRGGLRLTTPNSVVLDGPEQWSAAIRRAIEQC